MNRNNVSKISEDIPDAMSIKFSQMANELRQGGEDIVILSYGEAFFELPLLPFKDLPISRGFHYSDSRGIPELRQRLSKYYNEEYGIESEYANEILLSAGSKILSYIALAAIVNPGEEVLLLEPSWLSYIEQIKIVRGCPVSVPYNADVESIKKYITDKTKMVIINNPNNPSGKVYSKKELQILFDLAKKYNFFILSDEAYSEFVSTEPFISMLSFDLKKERVIVINSLSKNMGMSGWRVGYAISNKHIIDLMFRFNQHLISCPPTLLEYYFAKYFDQILTVTRPQISKLLALRYEVEQFMNALGLKYLPGTGTFYFCVSLDDSKLDSEEFALRLIKEHGVAVVPGISYGKSLNRFLRVSIGAEPSYRIKRGLEVIKMLIDETK